ncbi:unnamed protein product [Paramecium pentaurelia]|uniref:Uncharacterized protein n=1 Tax=Paramecium pentaurelia TaxID=43138 RepID=A0A8S1VER7_9CILI|nr:unnamed protein product [Paramecium pentaurelia]
MHIQAQNQLWVHGYVKQRFNDYIMQDYINERANCGLQLIVLDISDINYGFPENIEDFIHKINLDWRVVNIGEALNLIELKDLNQKLKDNLIKVFKQFSYEILLQLLKFIMS